MASVVYNSFLDDLNRGNIDFDTDTFYGMFVDATYVPDKDLHTKRSDITGEVIGAGYVAGGAATAVTITKDLVNDRVDIEFASIAFAAASITWRGCVLYKRRGGLASADELVAYVDNGTNTTSTAGTATQNFSTPLRFQN